MTEFTQDKDAMHLNVVKEYDIDDVLCEVGQFGRYQKKLYIYFNIQHIILALVALSIVFVGAEPPWKCSTTKEVVIRSIGFNEIEHEDAAAIEKDKCVRYEKRSCSVEVDQPDTSIVAEWDLYCSEFYKVALSQSLSFVGMLLGAWFLGPLADKIGRRKVYLYSSFIVYIATFVSGVSITFTQFAVARFFIGFGGAGCILCLFVILMEIIGPDYRASAGIVVSAFFSIGLVLLSAVAYLIPGWRLMTVIFAGVGFLHLFFYNIVPESPRWLLLKGHKEEALQMLKTLAAGNGKPLLSPMTLKKAETVERSSTILDLFSFQSIIIRTTVTTASWFSASFSYYGLSLAAGSLSDNLYVGSTLMGLVELPGYLICVLMIEKYGRKLLLVVTLILSGIACLVSGAIQWADQFTDTPMVGTIMLLSLIGKFAVSTAFALLYVYTTELFPTEARNKGMGLSSVAARFGGILAPFVSLLGNYCVGLPLIVMGVVPLVTGLLSLLLPETKGKSLPDTLQELRNS